MRWTVLSVVLIALILAPFIVFADQIDVLVSGWIGGDVSVWYAFVAIVALLTADVFLPIPSSFVAAAAGALLGFTGGAAAIWLGMMAGCALGYAFGARASASARRFVGDDGMRRAMQLAERYGTFTIALCRPIPVLAEASVIFAGVTHAPRRQFWPAAAWSNLGVALGYAAVGAFSMRVESFLVAFLGAIALPGLALLASKLWMPKRETPNRR